MRKIDIRTDKIKFYKQAVVVLNPFMNLTSMELEVLASLLYQYNMYLDRGETKHAAMVFIFSYESRLRIKELLNNISEGSLQNKLTSLRKKGIIEDNKIPDKYILSYEKDKLIVFNFTIGDDT